MMSLKGEYITGSVSEMKTEGTNTAEIETSNDSIVDISVEIDNNRLYENTFYQMYNEVKNNKEKISAAYEVDKGIQKRILRLEDDETEIYDRVARWSHTALMVETEKLIIRLFTLYCNSRIIPALYCIYDLVCSVLLDRDDSVAGGKYLHIQIVKLSVGVHIWSCCPALHDSLFVYDSRLLFQ